MDDITNKYDKLILALLLEKQKRLKAAYFEAIDEIAKITVRSRIKDGNFSFAKYPQIKKVIEKEVKNLSEKLNTEVVNGINRAWSLSNEKNTVFVDESMKGLKLSNKAMAIYYDAHDVAREAFQKERINGLNLSDRIWNVTDQFKKDLEIDIRQGVGTGESAASMARRMKKYLLVPDNRFRNVENEKLRKELQRMAARNRAGQGVYRSSYKNALRLTRDQVNRSYRTADYERWQTQFFVVGIKISLSNNHPLKPENEICELLAGDYPKDYVWKGNHVQCLCHATPIIITKKEREKWREALINGEEWKGKSENEITDVPQAYKDYIRKNADRLNAMKTMPDIVTENEKYLPKDIIKKLNS